MKNPSKKTDSMNLNGIAAKENINALQIKPKREKGILVTGGAGFIGTNVAHRLLSQGERVIIFDNLSRPGVEENLKWLNSIHPEAEILIADVRDKAAVERAVNDSKHVFHFAAQVAVTSSLVDPIHDFEVNIGGTLNVLEAIRLSAHKPSLIYTSTNKVYGDLSGLELDSNNSRYFPLNPVLYKNGISENISLNFHSPYGCSKGSADQYILDYARSFGLRTVVFRMSCIYGPHQFGTEDQGWIAHFVKQAINNQTITLYGDGKQVRDILYIDDLVNAFLLAKQNIGELAGEVFNMGGGPENSVSLVELLDYMNSLDHLNIQIEYDDWRTGDQKYYVSDTRKFRKRTGWRSDVSYMEGVTNLYNWLSQHYETATVHEKQYQVTSNE
jgi:CDP-paratose 2-epimerase